MGLFPLPRRLKRDERFAGLVAHLGVRVALRFAQGVGSGRVFQYCQSTRGSGPKIGV